MKRYIRYRNRLFDTTVTPCKQLFPYDSYDKVPDEFLEKKHITTADNILDLSRAGDLLQCTVNSGNGVHIIYIKGVSLAEKFDYEHCTKLYFEKGDDYICVAKQNRHFKLELKTKKKGMTKGMKNRLKFEAENYL